MLQIDVAGGKATEQQVTAFYSKNLPSGKWNKVFQQSFGKIGTVVVYFQEGLTGIYGFRVSTAKVDGKLIRQAMVGKIDGKLDFVKLLKIAGKLVAVR